MRGSAALLLGLMSCGSDHGFWLDTTPCEGSGGVSGEVPFDDDAMLCVQIEMSASDFQTMAAQQRWGSDEDELWEGVLEHVIGDCTQPFPDAYTWFEADLWVNGAAVREVGIRKKGFVGSVGDGSVARPSLKLDTDRWVDGQTLGLTEHITLNNSASDASRLHTCLAYSLFADAGYPAPRCNLANVVVNGQGLGAYTHVEAVKKDFLERAFGDDTGSLYEGTLADFTPSHLAGTPERLGRWEAKTDETDAAGEPLWRVTEALMAPDDELEQALAGVLNLERFFAFWALEHLVAHSDGYCAGTNNFYVYFDPDDDHRATPIPWGVDDAVSLGGDGEPVDWLQGIFVASELTRRVSRHPELSLRYHEALARIVDEVFDEALLLDRIDRWDEQVRSAERSDWHDREVEALRGWVETRRAQLERDLAAGVPEGDEEPADCYTRAGVDEMVEASEALSPLAHACASSGGRARGCLWMMSTVLLIAFRRRR
jgi:spore coat protein H